MSACLWEWCDRSFCRSVSRITHDYSMDMDQTCDPVVQLATVAVKCWQDRGDMDRIESSHQQAIIAGPVTYRRYGYNDQSLRRRARPWRSVRFWTDDEEAYCQGRSSVLLPHSPTPLDPLPCRQRRHHPCVGFDNAAVGLLQLGVRRPDAVDSRVVTESAERRYSACVWLTSSWSCLAILDATTLAACLVTSAV